MNLKIHHIYILFLLRENPKPARLMPNRASVLGSGTDSGSSATHPKNKAPGAMKSSLQLSPPGGGATPSKRSTPVAKCVALSGFPRPSSVLTAILSPSDQLIRYELVPVNTISVTGVAKSKSLKSSVKKAGLGAVVPVSGLNMLTLRRNWPEKGLADEEYMVIV